MRILITFFGLGTAPVAPGTVTSIAVLPLIAASAVLPVWARVALLGILILVSYQAVERHLALVTEKDPPYIVIDEVLGMMLMACFLPEASMTFEFILLVLLGLFLFRIFDISKPLGIARLEKIPGATGVIADDLLAGLYAGLSVFALNY